MLTFSTTATAPTWIPATASYGFTLFRADHGEPIHAYCVVYNRATTTGYVVPASKLCGSSKGKGWDDAGQRGLFPFWQSGGDWYTLLVFVNGSEETDDVLYVRLLDQHGSPCSDTETVYGIRNEEMLTFSTWPQVPVWIPVTASHGYIKWRAESGGCICPYCAIYNVVTETGFTVPAYDQDHGF